MEKVDALTLAAMKAGDEEADFDASRRNLYDLLERPLERATSAERTVEEIETRIAVGLSA